MIIIYDFDGTLTPNSVPKYKVLDKDIDIMSLVKNKMTTDCNLYQLFYDAYLGEFKKLDTPITNDILCMGSKKIEYCKGVPEFLEYLNGKNIKNYLLSSGLKVYLENTTIAKYFTKIYGTTLKYEDDEVIGLDYMLTDKDKARIIKQIVMENNLINCKDIIYIGDGLTDMEAFKYVFDNGGTAIFVYDKQDKIVKQPFISYYFKRDYTDNSELRNVIDNLILKDK